MRLSVSLPSFLPPPFLPPPSFLPLPADLFPPTFRRTFRRGSLRPTAMPILSQLVCGTWLSQLVSGTWFSQLVSGTCLSFCLKINALPVRVLRQVFPFFQKCSFLN